VKSKLFSHLHDVLRNLAAEHYASCLTFHVSRFTLALWLILLQMPVYSEVPIHFIDVTKQAGIQFKHHLGRSGKGYILETVASGCAFLDYDNDGYLDIYFVNGASLPGSPPVVARNALYRNNGDGTFTDVTEIAGVGDEGYGIGCCVGDYNNDGFIDLYVTNFERNTLYRNNGDGTFSDVTQAAGVGCEAWSSSCAFLDYDGDGALDLYVVNYLHFRLKDHKACGGRLRIDCGPSEYPGESDVLYRNNGDGTFTDVTQMAGVFNPEGKGLGIACGDYDNDGDTDIYIANDDTRNFLYRNNGNGTFSDVTFATGVGFSEDGEPEGGMGTCFGDYDNDGHLDLIVTNYQDQVNTLYHNDGDGMFSNVSHTSRTGPISYSAVGWGTGFIDYDNDGLSDLFVANGHLLVDVEKFDQTTTYNQPNFLFKNQGDGTFVEIGSQVGINSASVTSSRGAAFGDYDNDGDIDILISNTDETPSLLRNDGGNRNNWIGIRAIGTQSNRSAIGTRVKITVGNHTQMKEVTGGSSYASANDLRLLFGIGGARVVDEIEIRWPTGRIQTKRQVKANQYMMIVE
jgi:hypothetical protein